MAAKPAAYPELAAHCRQTTAASGVVLIVIGGDRGTGITVEADPLVGLSLSTVLRVLADEWDARQQKDAATG